MLMIIFTLALIWVTFKFVIFGLKAAWGIAKLVCTILLLPLVLIGLCMAGLAYVALGILILAAIFMLVTGVLFA
ncbi:MAG: hypothetical protein IJ716_16060 [Lachnospiraceae bacterium]|nr:hypothetical protein [Lachnospiraceae bacterium]